MLWRPRIEFAFSGIHIAQCLSDRRYQRVEILSMQRARLSPSGRCGPV
uniref:Uncharacterized protein n=1 Tax=uncultured bacterium A1Q1_fos_1807 TaxID=1256552 RepID=L7VS20_9BACT|nr:hypothetical protein [uncultured bacterium A1Q1_fos_1807]